MLLSEPGSDQYKSIREEIEHTHVALPTIASQTNKFDQELRRSYKTVACVPSPVSDIQLPLVKDQPQHLSHTLFDLSSKVLCDSSSKPSFKLM